MIRPSAGAILGASGMVLGAVCPFLVLAPNRLVTGTPIGLWNATGSWRFAVLGLCAVLAMLPRRAAGSAMAAAACLVWALLLAAGQGATLHLRGMPPAARAGLGGGFFLLLTVAVLALMQAARRRQASVAARLGMSAALLAGAALIAATGQLQNLSLVREYQAHRAAFAAALLRHMLLVGCTLLGALALGVPLGFAAWRRRGTRPGIFGTLNVVQTIPSVALFGLLIAPLTAAGLSGIGMVPAVIALILYALLPTVQGMVAGLDGVAAAPLEAAAGMGMTQTQVFLRVRLPLAAPALLAAARIVVVQAVGLAVVAALIGAGGLGDFVFQGLGQYAIDLVLLGALPATGLALFADALLSLAASAAAARAA